MLSIRFDSVESWRIVSLAVDSWYRKSISQRLWICRTTGVLGGWLENVAIRVDSNQSTRIVSFAVDSWYRKSICARLRTCSTTGVLGWLENVAIRDDSIESTNYRKKVIKIILAVIIRAKTGLNISSNRDSPANRAHVMPAESYLGETSQPASFNQALNKCSAVKFGKFFECKTKIIF